MTNPVQRIVIPDLIEELTHKILDLREASAPSIRRDLQREINEVKAQLRTAFEGGF